MSMASIIRVEDVGKDGFSAISVSDRLLEARKRLTQSVDYARLDEIWYGRSTGVIAAAAESARKIGSDYVLRETSKITDQYKLGKVLGVPGQYGTVKECTNKKTGEKLAVKLLKKHKYHDRKRTKQYFEDLRSEIYLLSVSHDHPYIVSLGTSSGNGSVFEDIQTLYIIMERCDGGELYDRIQKMDGFSESHAQQLIRCIMSALYFLHEQGIAHCDLKPENFVFKSGDPKHKDYNTLKLIDFGMAKVVHWRKYLRKLVGTPYYIAPECLEGRYNEGCDMWSIGVVLFVMIFGFPPFYDDTKSKDRVSSDQVIFSKIKKGFTPKTKAGYGPWFPKDHKVSTECRDLLGRLLRKSIADRLTAEEVLEHPWLNKDVPSAALHKITDACLKDVDPRVQKEEVEQMFQAIDANNDGAVDYDELVTMRINKKLRSKESRLRKVFQALDKDGDGYVTTEELHQALDSVSDQPVTMEYCAALISEVDLNCDGRVSYEEFLKVWDHQSGTTWLDWKRSVDDSE
jgi:calcium-dependent protein kinase